MPPIYLDNAASTRVSDDVLALMTEVMRTAWGNPSSSHPQGAAARTHIETARTRLLTALGDRGAVGSARSGPDGSMTRGHGDVVWTSGCSESNALAVFGAAQTHPGSIIISTLEHPAVSTLADKLATDGRPVHRVSPATRSESGTGPAPSGVLDPDELAAIAKDAGVVSLIMVQNEIGVVEPIAALAAAVRTVAPNAHIHVDAAQALGKVALDVGALGVDSISIAGHKLHGPKGTGALWLAKSARISPLWIGGGQQKGLRGGTQDAPGAAGLGLAAANAVSALATARTRWLEFAGRVTSHLAERGVQFRQLVPDFRRAPHILALGIAGVPASALRTVLSSRGIYISTGSACADGDSKASPVLEAIGLPADHGMVRLSFALDTTQADVDEAARVIADVALELRKKS